MATVCKHCGGTENVQAWDYCDTCWTKHEAGELPLGACNGCQGMFTWTEEETETTAVSD